MSEAIAEDITIVPTNVIRVTEVSMLADGKIAYHDKYGSNAEIKALYFGTPKDKILILKEGMDLPKVSKEIEEYFNNQSNKFMPY